MGTGPICPRGEYWPNLPPGWVLVLPPPGHSTAPISTRGEFWSYLHLALGWALVLSPSVPRVSTFPISTRPGVVLILFPPKVGVGPICTRPRGEYWSYLPPGWVGLLVRPWGEYWSYLQPQSYSLRPWGEYCSYLRPQGEYCSYLTPVLGLVLVLNPPGAGVSTGPIYTRLRVSTGPISLRPWGKYWSYLHPAPGWVGLLVLSPPGVSTGPISLRPRGEYSSYLLAPGWVLVQSHPVAVLVLSAPGPVVRTGPIWAIQRFKKVFETLNRSLSSLWSKYLKY